MHNDKFTDFDLELRSVFQEAEEEVPSRLWESLSAELDRRERRKVVAFRWKRAAAYVAAAAAVMSGIFILTKSRADLLQPIPPQTVAQIQEPVAPQSSDNGELSLEDQIAASARLFLADVPQPVKASVSKAGQSETVPSEIFEAADDLGTIEESPETESTGQPQTSGSDTKVKKQAEPWRDPFAALDDDRNIFKRNVSFTLAGNVMSNDATSESSRIRHSSPLGSVVKTGITEKSVSTYGIPLSLGIGARITLNDKWFLGTGIDWTLLSRSFTGIYTEAGSDGSLKKSVYSNIAHELHYIGIPLNLYYRVLNDNDINFYVWGGADLEKGISNKYRIHSEPEDIIYKERINGLQLSAGLGLGVEFSLNDRLCLYIDPSARYYFDCGQPSSVRTQKPFMLNFEAGLRFDL